MRRGIIAWMAGIALVLAACASTPEVGVRPDFEQKRVQRIAVVPFYTLSTFSLSQDELDQVLRESEQTAVESLRAGGFEVIEPRAFRQQLAEAGVATRFDDGVLLRNELSNYFEPARKSGQPSLEVATIQQLYQEGNLPADALLFGEVVYHTKTQCRADPTRYNEHAQVSGQSASPGPSPCVVSHFQAKLVYAPTGETMWFNRMLLQTHTDRATEQADRQNMVETVARTLAGPDGLRAFRTSSKTAALDEKADKE